MSSVVSAGRPKGVRWLIVVLAPVLLVITGIPSLWSAHAAPPPSTTLLYVAGSHRPPAGDRPIVDRWVAMGVAIDIVDDDALPSTSEIEQYDLVWISSSVLPTTVAGRLAGVDVPIGVSEPFILRNMNMATRAGERAAQTKLRLADQSSVVVTSAARNVSWGAPADDAQVVATVLNDSSRAAVFTYAEGDTLTNGTAAPQCRAGFFASYQTPEAMLPAGFALLDDVIDFLIACRRPNSPPIIGPVVAQSNTEGDDVSLHVEASDPDVGDTVTFSATGLPDGLSIEPTSGAITGTISYRGADGSVYATQVHVADGRGAQASTTFEWAVVDDPTLDPPKPDMPNVLVVMTDDQTVEQMRWLTSVDAFMAGGTEYANSITNYPLCGPSRTTFLTGQYATNHELECNSALADKFHARETDSLGPWLQERGVYTIHVGKYLNGYGRKASSRYVPSGWDDWRALSGDLAYHYTKFDMVINGDFVQYGRNGATAYSTDVLSGHLDDALRAVPVDQPFFAVFTPLAPHYQKGTNYAIPAPRHVDTIADVLRPPNYNSCGAGKYECPVRGSDLLRSRLTNTTKSIIDNGYQTSSETLLAVDEAFVRAIDTLDELGRLDDTVVVFTSDNGFSYGEHGIELGKRVPTRESLFVPLYINGPGFDTGERVSEPVVNADLAPTIVDLFDADPTIVMDGQSLLDPLSHDRPILIQAKPQPGTRGYMGAYADGWLFIDWVDLSRNEMYHPDDIWQLETLDNDREWNATEAALQALTDRLERCSGASCREDWVAPAEP